MKQKLQICIGDHDVFSELSSHWVGPPSSIKHRENKHATEKLSPTVKQYGRENSQTYSVKKCTAINAQT